MLFSFDETVLQVGADGEIVLGPMSTEDWNEYHNEMARELAKPAGERNIRALDISLFDRKLLRVKNLEAQLLGGEIRTVTVKTPELIPEETKLSAVFLTYKGGSNIDVKKSVRTSGDGGSVRKSRGAKSARKKKS